MGEEFAEHEGVVGLLVVLWQAYILVHVECDDMLEARNYLAFLRETMGYKTHESFPSFTSLIKALYVGIGDDPVGKPRTNGLFSVGAKSLIL
jgi:hypothetical protein